MNKSSSTYQEIPRRIHHGIYSPGEKLPGEIVLAAELGVSRVTLRSALKQLVSEGIVESYGRSGNYVSMSIPGKRFLLLIGGSTEKLGVVEQYLSSLLRQNLVNAPSLLLNFTKGILSAERRSLPRSAVFTAGMMRPNTKSMCTMTKGGLPRISRLPSRS